MILKTEVSHWQISKPHFVKGGNIETYPRELGQQREFVGVIIGGTNEGIEEGFQKWVHFPLFQSFSSLNFLFTISFVQTIMILINIASIQLFSLLWATPWPTTSPSSGHCSNWKWTRLKHTVFSDPPK